MRRRAVWTAAGAAAVALAAVLLWSANDESSAGENDARQTAAATTAVQRRDLVERESLDSSLGFADVRPLTASRAGTLTWLAREGSTVRRGQRLYEVDGTPVYLLYGAKPAWRPLSRGSSDGLDVRQLERNLVALGYDPSGAIDVDEEFDEATEAAVKRWERARGVKADGVVELGEVVFLPGARRIGSHKAGLGTMLQPGAELTETSSPRRVVTLQLEASRQGLVSEGDRVRVELPDGRLVTGTVADVGRVAQKDVNEQGEEGEPYVEVTVRVRATSGALDEAPVDVHVVRTATRNVLTVPVSALLALPGGGYAVEVESGGTRRIVRVRTGAFADGYVEIAGKGIREGTKVVVPR